MLDVFIVKPEKIRAPTQNQVAYSVERFSVKDIKDRKKGWMYYLKIEKHSTIKITTYWKKSVKIVSNEMQDEYFMWPIKYSNVFILYDL